VRYKYIKDEEQRDKMLIKMRDKLDRPVTPPELFDMDKLRIEQEEVKEYFTIDANRQRYNVERQHEEKYQKHWAKDYTAKLHKTKKYDLSDARYKNLWKCPQNVLVFNGKLLEYMQKIGVTTQSGGGSRIVLA